MITSHTHTTQLLHDSIDMKDAKTMADLAPVCAAIEERFKREGADDATIKAYELEKAEHVKRVARAMVA